MAKHYRTILAIETGAACCRCAHGQWVEVEVRKEGRSALSFGTVETAAGTVVEVAFSYREPIAFSVQGIDGDYATVANRWGTTTGTHINKAADRFGINRKGPHHRVDAIDFRARLAAALAGVEAHEYGALVAFVRDGMTLDRAAEAVRMLRPVAA